MTPARENEWVMGDDGIRARRSGDWAKVKLSYLNDFIPPALQATGKSRYPKLQRWYVDLFAGPGRNVDRRTGENFPGSFIRAVPLSAQSDQRIHFTHAVAVNKDPDDHAALVERVRRLRSDHGCPIPEGNTRVRNDDTNRVISDILGEIDQRAYALVVADITRPSHWPWSSVMTLRSQGPASLDFYMLFPEHTAINRMMLAWKREAVAPNASALTRFFGTTAWEQILDRPRTDATSAEAREAALGLYVRQLKSEARFKHAFVVRNVSRNGTIPMYRMIFATNSDVAAKIGEWSKNKKDHGEEQPRFL
jgi:three-Cys-motif partner protein